MPKNFAQDIVVAAEVLGHDVPMHKYAIQITVADVRDGALSGSTLKEASSWGKVDTTYEQMVYCEATIAVPLIVGYAYHKRGLGRAHVAQVEFGIGQGSGVGGFSLCSKSASPAPCYCVTQPLSDSDTAFVALIAVPVNVPHPEAGLVGAGVPETPQPPDIVSLSWVPLGLFFETPVTCLQLTPIKLTVTKSAPVSVAVKMPRNGVHWDWGRSRPRARWQD